MNHYVFTKYNDYGYIILALYVDDIIIIGKIVTGIDELKMFIIIYFHTRDLGNLKYLTEVTMSK